VAGGEEGKPEKKFPPEVGGPELTRKEFETWCLGKAYAVASCESHMILFCPAEDGFRICIFKRRGGGGVEDYTYVKVDDARNNITWLNMLLGALERLRRKAREAAAEARSALAEKEEGGG